MSTSRVNVRPDDASVLTRGPDLALGHTWDSVRALKGDGTTAGEGWDTDLSPSMGGVLTQTVSFTDSSGTRWLFPYYGNTGGGGPFSQYNIPPGQPWALSTSPITGYTLNNILTGETLSFDAQGRLQATTDAYGNQNTLTPGTNQPTGLSNSGGRALAVTYNGNGLLADAQSPLWQSRGANAAGSQHITYGYTPQGQLTTLTRGAGTPDALTATFGYNGAELVTVTTPYTQSQHTWTLGYDPQGRVTSVTSPGQGQQGQAGYTPSYTTQFTYGVSQTVVVEGVGTSGALTHTYTLDAQGNAPQLTDVAGQGHVRTATFDIDHDVISGTDALGNTTLYTHTYMGPTGNVGLLTQEQQPAVRPFYFDNALTPVTTTYKYDPATYDRIEEDKPNGGIIRYTYDGHHAISTTAELVDPTTNPPTWRGSVNSYDQYGELIATTDGRGVRVDGNGVVTLDPTTAISYTGHLGYDAQGDQTSASTAPITTTLGGTTRVGAPVTTTTGYDLDGNAVTATSANDNTSATSYDHLGRAVQASDPRVTLYDNTAITPTMTTRYDGDGNVVSTQDPTGAVTADSYDPLGRLVVETNPVSGTTIYTYTATNKAFDQTPGGDITQYTYNTGGELATATDPVSGTVAYQYDGVGNIVAITTSDSTTSPPLIDTIEARSYDALNRVVGDTISAPGAGQQTTRTAYDLDGNVFQTQQPNGDTVLDSHDKADRPTEEEIDTGPVTGPSGVNYEYYTNDAAGNQVESIDRDGRDLRTTYDADSRIAGTTSSDPGGSPTLTTTWSYDPDGNALSRVMQAAGQVTHTYSATYNSDDERTSETDDGVTTGYGFDAAGAIRTQTMSGSGVPIPLTRALDAAGRTTAIGEALGGATAYTSAFGYNANNLPTTIALPGGVGETGAYGPGGRLTRVAATGPATATNPLASAYDYGYSPLGWTSAVTTTLNGQASVQQYSYDGLGRLSGVAGGARWGYDANDNIAAITTSAGTISYGYTASQPNMLQTVSASGVITAYGYDKNGDTTSITNTAGTVNTRLGYDARARLAQVTLADGTRVAMGYNASNRRSSYTVTKGGVVTLGEAFAYRGSELAQTVVTGTGVSTPYTDTYVYNAQGGPLELLRQPQGGGVSRYWYVLDGRGSVVALTSITGTVVDRYSYDAWGQPTSTTEQVAQPYRYAGYWYDGWAGGPLPWYWLQLREYDPGLERFLQPDPSGEDGVRTYVYAGDDPLDLVDPTGFGLCEWFLVGGAVCGTGTVLHGAWQFVAGDDFQTLSDPNASFADKAFAVVDLGSDATLFIPFVGEGVKGGELAAKGFLYVSGRLSTRKLTRETVEAGLRKGFRILTRDLAEACTRCFPAGTKVATPHGMRTIDKIHVGDAVLAENPRTGKVETETVQAKISDPVSPLIAVNLSDGSAITVTADHPFWLDSGARQKPGIGGWVAAGQLRQGDHLRTASGVDITVTGLQRHAGEAAVYTLTVAHDHTFFVGNARVLVHNAGPCGPLRISARSLYHVIARHLSNSSLARAIRLAGKVSSKDVKGGPGESQFFSNLTVSDLRQLILDAFNRSNVEAAWSQAGNRFVGNIGLDRDIGYDKFGRTTRFVRIVVTGTGDLVTIYPVS